METEVDISTQRERLIAALLLAGQAAFPPGEYVGQESFVKASEALALAQKAGVVPEALVLDVCCGAGRLATHIARQTGCRIVGIDSALPAVNLARSHANRERIASRAYFLHANSYHLPVLTRFDAALIFEVMLSIEDKPALLAELRRCLRPGGRLGLTLEAGLPLSKTEQTMLPWGDQVWLVTEQAFRETLVCGGFHVLHIADHTPEHHLNARRMAEEFERRDKEIVDEIGDYLFRQLLCSYRQWENWLSTGRVRKLAIVAERNNETLHDPPRSDSRSWRLWPAAPAGLPS